MSLNRLVNCHTMDNKLSLDHNFCWTHWFPIETPSNTKSKAGQFFFSFVSSSKATRRTSHQTYTIEITRQQPISTFHGKHDSQSDAASLGALGLFIILADFIHMTTSLWRHQPTNEARGGVEEVDGRTAISDEGGFQPQGLQHLHLCQHNAHGRI